MRIETLRAAAALIAASTACALGTVDERGAPAVTYVPFAPVDGALGIVVSRLAVHTASLLAHRPASLLLVRAARDGGDPYERARLTMSVAPRAGAVALEPRGGRLVLGFASAHELAAGELGALLRGDYLGENWSQ